MLLGCRLLLGLEALGGRLIMHELLSHYLRLSDKQAKAAKAKRLAKANKEENIAK